MTDQELRALVRDAVSRHFSSAPAPIAEPNPDASFERVSARAASGAPHPSHAMYMTVVNVGDSCVIEPGVTCNHCGYCKSHGH
jgi:hypothetical protein